MDYKFWLDLSRIVGIVGSICALIAGIGVMYFGNIVSKMSKKEILSLEEKNSELHSKILNQQTEIIAIKQETGEKSEQIDALKSIEQKRAIANAEFEKLKRTPPNFECNLWIEKDIGEIYLTIQFIFKNDVPIFYRPSIEEVERKDIFPRLFSKLPECRPSDEIGRIFKCKYAKLNELRYVKGNHNEITMSVNYKSIYSEEVNAPNLGGNIVKRYNLDLDAQRLVEIK